MCKCTGWRKGIPNANALVVLLLGLPVASERGEAWREFVRQMGWDGLARAAFDTRGDDLLLFVSEGETKVASTEETKEMKQEPIADINLEFNW